LAQPTATDRRRVDNTGRVVDHCSVEGPPGARVSATRTGPWRDVEGPAAPQPGWLTAPEVSPEAQEPHPPEGHPIANDLAVTSPVRTKWSMAARTISSDSDVAAAICDTVEQPARKASRTSRRGPGLLM